MNQGLLGGLLGEQLAQALFEGNELVDAKIKVIKNEKNCMSGLDCADSEIVYF
ncbi:MAG: hypothetical protein GX587_04225 [Bacteroidales bacterium]|jgi:hypothetical protein|nr:hypothetical protein [Bacteroidales bacterium]